MPPSTRNGCKSGRIFCVRFLFARSGERRTYRYASVFLFLLPQEVCGAAGLCHKSGGCFVSGKYFTGDQKLSKKLIGRTKEALRQRNVQFAQTHGDASDEELLDYVRGEAARLGMTPNAGEIIGGHFIAFALAAGRMWSRRRGWSRRRSRSPSPSGRSSRRSSAVRRESGHTQSNRTAASNPDEEGDPLLPS